MAQAHAVGVPRLPLGRIVFAMAMVPGMYLTLALSGALALGVGGGAIYGVYYMFTHGGRIPGKLVILALAVAAGGLIGALAVLRGVIASLRRPEDFEPGIWLSRARERELHECVKGVCDELGCRPPDAVLLHPEPTFSARQGKVSARNGSARGRILTIGCPLLGALSVDQFRAIIAHEMAHFTGRDTLYSVFVVPVYVGTLSSIEVLGEQTEGASGAGEEHGCVGCAYTLPMLLPLLILNLYLTIFARIDKSISRIREQRADVIAAHLAGRDTFINALRLTVRVGGVFGEYFDAKLQRLAHAGGPSGEDYFVEFIGTLPESREKMDAFEAQVFAETDDTYADHPALRTRMQYLPNVQREPHDTRPVRELLANPDEQERELTELCEFLTVATAAAHAQADPRIGTSTPPSA